jgi:mono/diheme cytochrome c family protein
VRPTSALSRLGALPISVALLATPYVSSASDPVPTINHTQTTYLESCGGCHGIQGHSAAGLVPSLRDQAGFFLCTPAGRQYIVQLPDVAFADVSDEELAALLNFVVFELGGPSSPKGAKPYTAEEVRQLRSDTPLRAGLRERRHAVVAELAKTCRGAASLAKPEIGY